MKRKNDEREMRKRGNKCEKKRNKVEKQNRDKEIEKRKQIRK